MDNYGDLVDLVAGGVWLRNRWRSDSPRAGHSCDRIDIQSGLGPTNGLTLAGKTRGGNRARTP